MQEQTVIEGVIDAAAGEGAGDLVLIARLPSAIAHKPLSTLRACPHRRSSRPGNRAAAVHRGEAGGLDGIAADPAAASSLTLRARSPPPHQDAWSPYERRRVSVEHRNGGANMKIRLFAVTALVLILGFLPGSARAGRQISPINPVIFVHGGSGSGAQFESQAQRFTSNGYPHDLIAVQEYDSTFTINTVADIYASLDQLIAALLEQTGADQVDILGHSLGTTLMIGYLDGSPERAAKVAHYVNIDGRTSDHLPGGVPTLALWAGRGTPGRQIVGATNVTIPDVTHVQCATSAESFVEMYKFFTGEDPATKDILPEPRGQVRLAGRAVIFPQNRGAEDRTLEIWRVDDDTGARIDDKPKAVFPISADGEWGPFKAKGGQRYEFVLLLEGAFTHHLYYEPFMRSDYLIRLNTEEPGTGVGALLDSSDHQSDLILIRYKEF
jgi:pimeloyl-ACP methyl ester carboxylesterase